MQQRIENRENAEWESESPNGRYIAYIKQQNKANELFLYEKSTAEETQLTQNFQDSIFAHSINHMWSADSKQLSFMSGPDWYNQFIRVYDLASKTTEVVSPRGYMNSGLLWLNDNKTLIANIKIRNENLYELWSLDTESKALTQLTDSINLHPSLSPDGNWVLFESQRNLDDGDIYIMRPDGSQQTRLTNSPEYEGRAAWFVLDKK